MIMIESKWLAALPYGFDQTEKVLTCKPTFGGHLLQHLWPLGVPVLFLEVFLISQRLERLRTLPEL